MMRDPRAEAVFTSKSVEFEYIPVVPLERFDFDASRKIQSRLKQRVIPALREQYTRMFKQRSEPPAVIAFERNERLLFADGLHRGLAAVDSGLVRALDCYLLRCRDGAVLDALIRTFNRLINGERQTDEEATLQALFWMYEHGRTLREAAEWWELSPATLSRAAAVERVRSRLHGAGGCADGLADTALERLDALTNDRVLAQAVELIRRAGLKVDATKEIIRLIAAASRTEEAQLRAVEAYAARPEIAEVLHRAATGRAPVHKPLRNRAIAHARALANLLEAARDWGTLQIDTADDFAMIKAHLRVILEGERRLDAVSAAPPRAPAPAPMPQAAHGAHGGAG